MSDLKHKSLAELAEEEISLGKTINYHKGKIEGARQRMWWVDYYKKSKEEKGTLIRYSINQPNTNQEFHHLHGTKVLAEDTKEETVRMYFTEGNVISQIVPTNILTRGWFSV